MKSVKGKGNKGLNKTTKISVQPSTELMVSHEMAYAKMDMTPVQMDVVSLLLAEIGKETDKDEQRNYTLTAEQFRNIKNYKNKHDVYEIMRERVTGKDRLSKVDMTIYRNDEDIEAYPWFTSVRYFNGSLILHVNPEVKQMLVELKKSDRYKVFAALQFILPMKSYYSKRVYLMCRNYVSGGEIYKIDWQKFRESVCVPASYSDSMVRKVVLDKAKEEINKLSDLLIDYKLLTETGKGRGGRKTVGVSFEIKRKAQKKELTESQQTAIEHKKAGTYQPPDKPIARKTSFNNFEQRDYDFEQLELKLLTADQD